MDLKKYIASINDFPKKEIIFRDVTPILQNPQAYSYVCEKFLEYAKKQNATAIVAPEARGFMFGCPVAVMQNIAFIPVRKPGKLPRETICEEYSLEYGKNVLSMHIDALSSKDRVIIIDDLLATGGTALAAAKLCERLNAKVVGMAFVVDLVDLKGRELLNKYDILTLTEYEGE